MTGFSKFICIRNKADVNKIDFLQHLFEEIIANIQKSKAAG
jgi:hypothetical protein